MHMHRTWISVGLNQRLIFIDYGTVNDSDAGELHNAVMSGETCCFYIHDCQPGLLLASPLHALRLVISTA